MKTGFLMEEFTQFLNKTMGLHFRKESWPIFSKKFEPIIKDFGFKNEAECMQWLMTSPLTEDHIAVLAHHLTVGETYFFRDAHAFEKLETLILPSLIERKAKEDRHLRIWSAACCTGEEPYSIAMTLRKIIPNLHEWNISILATDINPHFLKSAKEGLFRDWSFRATPQNMKQKYFRREENEKWRIDPVIKNMVQFHYLNLVDDSYPSLLNGTNAMDLILCNNVLIYFQESTINDVIDKMANSLVIGGWLLVTPVESPYVKNKHLAPHGYAFQKTALLQPVAETIKPVKPTVEFEMPSPPPPPPEKIREEHTAFSLYEKGRYDEVIALLKEENTPEYILLVSKCYGNKGALPEALAWCTRALALDKMNPLIYYLKSTIEQELGDSSQAIESLKKAIYLDSKFIIAHLNLGHLLRESGNRELALKHYRNALSLLNEYENDTLVPHSEDLNAGILKEIITTIQGVKDE